MQIFKNTIIIIVSLTPSPPSPPSLSLLLPSGLLPYPSCSSLPLSFSSVSPTPPPPPPISLPFPLPFSTLPPHLPFPSQFPSPTPSVLRAAVAPLECSRPSHHPGSCHAAETQPCGSVYSGIPVLRPGQLSGPQVHTVTGKCMIVVFFRNWWAMSVAVTSIFPWEGLLHN